MEFMSPDKEKGWATVVRLSGNVSDAYLLKPKGLAGDQDYRVTFDNTGKAEIVSGDKLMTNGLRIQGAGESALGAGTFRGFRTRRSAHK